MLMLPTNVVRDASEASITTRCRERWRATDRQVHVYGRMDLRRRHRSARQADDSESTCNGQIARTLLARMETE